jgi:hypothetical protein
MTLPPGWSDNPRIGAREHVGVFALMVGTLQEFEGHNAREAYNSRRCARPVAFVVVNASVSMTRRRGDTGQRRFGK